MLPSSTELTYFYEAALAANFSHAAKKMNISQPTLSMAIKRLEDSLKTTLFYRQKQGLILTRAGTELFRHVSELLKQWEKIHAQITASHQEIQGRVVIGCNSAYVAVIAESISKLLARYPALDIHIINESSQKITDKILDTSIDIGMALNPAEHANLVINTISNPDMTFWIRKDSVTAKKSLLTGDAIIICDPTMPQTKMLLDQLPATINIRMTNTNSLESTAHLTVNGDGIGILPECYVRTFYHDQLERIADAPYCSNKSCLIYRVEDKEVAAVQVVLSSLKDIIINYQRACQAEAQVS